MSTHKLINEIQKQIHDSEPIILIGGECDGETTIIDKGLNEVAIPKYINGSPCSNPFSLPFFAMIIYRRTNRQNFKGLTIFE